MALLEKAFMFTFNGEETSVTPKMQVTFMKQLPTILPNARSRCPFSSCGDACGKFRYACAERYDGGAYDDGRYPYAFGNVRSRVNNEIGCGNDPSNSR